MIRAPEGFRLVRRGSRLILFADEIADAALAVGLDEPWSKVQPALTGPGAGRGPRAVVALPGGPALLLKQCLRGGLAARFNRERYFSRRRFLRELEASRAARAAGLPVGETLGVVLAPGRPGWRVWALARLVPETQNLARWLSGVIDAGAVGELWQATLKLVHQMHEAGLEHADLNLGNLVARRGTDGRWNVFAVDLDRARWWGGPVSQRRRERVLARLARSRRKLVGAAAS